MKLRLGHARGSITVEMAFALPVFLMAVYLVVECARGLYILNTLAEASRRALRGAVVANFSDPAALERVRKRAVFDTPRGELPFGAPFGASNLQVSYLSADGVTAASPMPVCPEANHAACTADPASSGCIRYVRIRVCQPDEVSTCTPVQYQPLFNVPGPFRNIDLPQFETLAPVESLGRSPGALSTCP